MKYMSTKFSDFLNEARLTDNGFVKELVNKYHIDPERAFTICKAHLEIMREKNPRKKKAMIEQLFKDLQIEHDIWAKLREYINTWCDSELNEKLLELGDYAETLFIEQYKYNLKYNDKEMLDEFIDEIIDKAEELNLNEDLLEIKTDILCNNEEKFKDKEKTFYISYDSYEILYYEYV